MVQVFLTLERIFVIQLIFEQVKKRIIRANLKISDFEIDNFIELQKERAPTKYNYSHIFIE